MKNILFAFTACLLFLCSCSDPCDDVNCGPGTCVEGTCDCPDGFSGTNCEIEDLCFAIDCGDNGTCDPGTGECLCDDGYTGDNCETELRAGLLGIWMGSDWVCDGEAPEMIGVEIEAGAGIFDLLLGDPDDDEVELTGVMSADGKSFEMPMQDVLIDGELYTYSGNGALDDNNVLTFNVSVSFGAFGADCTGTLTK